VLSKIDASHQESVEAMEEIEKNAIDTEDFQMLISAYIGHIRTEVAAIRGILSVIVDHMIEE
jgi:hypothetical protein